MVNHTAVPSPSSDAGSPSA